jgi:1-acyl-sn-glycerol-3-phosphate acyltransferase
MRTRAHSPLSPVAPRLRAVVLGVYAALSMAFFVLAQLPVMIVTRSGDFSIWLARRLWSPSALWVAGVRPDVRAPHGFPAGPAIYASNHESALDVWLLLCTIPRNVRFIAKRELFRIPILGWYLALARFISVDRRDRAQAIAALRRAGQTIREGTSLIVFPEGTRSVDGTVHPFKKGPFVVAMEAGVPVVPVAISGAAALIPKGKWEVRAGMARVLVGEPVMPRDFPDKTALLREVRRRIIAQHQTIGGLGGDLEHAVAAPGMEGRG